MGGEKACTEIQCFTTGNGNPAIIRHLIRGIDFRRNKKPKSSLEIEQ